MNKIQKYYSVSLCVICIIIVFAPTDCIKTFVLLFKFHASYIQGLSFRFCVCVCASHIQGLSFKLCVCSFENIIVGRFKNIAIGNLKNIAVGNE